MTDLSPHQTARIEQAHDRIGVVETRVGALEIKEAVMDERYKNIQGSLETIKGSITKVGWIVIGSIITAFMGFLLSGGLNVLGS